MTHFRLRISGRMQDVLARSARDAIRLDAAKQAPTGSELLNAYHVVVATRQRVEFGEDFIIAWVPTSAWPDLEPPIDLEALLEEEEGAS